MEKNVENITGNLQSPINYYEETFDNKILYKKLFVECIEHVDVYK